MADSLTKLPRELYTAAQVQQMDQIAIKEFGLDGFALMQSAAAAAFTQLLQRWPHTRFIRVYTGAGNNGGDGFVVAGLAKDHGIGVLVIELGEARNIKGDAERARKWARERNVKMVSYAQYKVEPEGEHAHSVIVDALLGIGLAREVEGEFKQAIEEINQSSNPVLAIDIPSGLNADTGQSLGATVVADHTSTFIGVKQGLLTHQGRDFTGEISFHDLGIPEQISLSDSTPVPSARRIDINQVRDHLPPRNPSSHKGSNGHVAVIGGDYSFGGAILMSAEAALRSGAGLVSVVTRSSHRPAILARRPELMVLGTEDEGLDLEPLLASVSSIVIGPGLGRSAWSRRLFELALAAQLAGDSALVLDADALHFLAERGQAEAEIPAANRRNWILTPHPGEAAVLLDCSVSAVQNDRFRAVTELQRKWGGAWVLKGSGSLICTAADDPEKLFLCTEGNAGMGSGGMGDVLTGILASLRAQGMSAQESLCSGVCIHGEAADIAAELSGERGTLATDLYPYIQQLVNLS